MGSEFLPPKKFSKANNKPSKLFSDEPFIIPPSPKKVNKKELPTEIPPADYVLPGFDSSGKRLPDERGSESVTAKSSVGEGKDKNELKPDTPVVKMVMSDETIEPEQHKSSKSNQQKNNNSKEQLSQSEDATVSFTITVEGKVSGVELIRQVEIQIFGKLIDGIWLRGSGDNQEAVNLEQIYGEEGETTYYEVDVNLELYRSIRGQTNRARGRKTQDSTQIAERFLNMPDSDEKSALSAEIDRRYYEATGIKPGTTINNPEQEANNVTLWNVFRDEVLSQREFILNRSQKVKLLIRDDSEGIKITPKDYNKAIGLIQKIGALDKSLVEDYASQIAGKTESLEQLEQQLDKFLENVKQRQNDLEEREGLKTQLYGLEEVYEKYREYKLVANLDTLLEQTEAGRGIVYQQILSQRAKELQAALQQQGFKSIPDFEKLISNYESAFEKETKAIAFDALAKYEHSLYEQDKNPQATAETKAQNQEQRQNIQKTRVNLNDNPELIYKLDKLLALSYQTQGIKSGSIYDLIIQDRIKTVQVKETLRSLATAILAIALGFVSGGGGTVGAVAAVGSFGLGAAQVLEEYQKYDLESAASEVGLLSQDPSFAWVVVAIVGAGLDLAAAKQAISSIKPAIKTFNETSDLAKLSKTLQNLADVDKRIQAKVLEAAQARLKYREAVQGLVSPGSRLSISIVPGGEDIPKLVEVAFRFAKLGINNFEQFLLELKAQKLVEEINQIAAAAPTNWLKQLPVEQQGVLRQAFDQGQQRIIQLINEGRQSLSTALGNFQPQFAEDIAPEAVAQTLDKIFASGSIPEQFALSQLVRQLSANENAAAISDFLGRVTRIRDVDGVINGRFDELYDAFQRGDAILVHGPLQEGEFPTKKHILEANRFSLLGNVKGNPAEQLTSQTKWSKTIDFVIIRTEGSLKLIFGQEHSGISGGRGYVYAAGEFIIDNRGNVLSVTNQSGHYRPTDENVKRAYNLLIEKGFINKSVQLEIR